MKFNQLLVAALATTILAGPAGAEDRYVPRPPVVLSPDLSGPWVLQLRGPQAQRASAPSRTVQQSAPRVVVRRSPDQQRQIYQPRLQQQQQQQQQQAALVPPQNPATKSINPIYLPQDVSYNGPEKPGTIVIDTSDRYLYPVQGDGMARRYGVGVGKEGHSWSGKETITRKAEWPDWRPPAEMIAREKKKGRILPVRMEGGPENPLGARALYLGSTLYRIHGTNQPWTIGGAVSSGCIRMRNEDVTDLYDRVKVGTKVIVR